MATLCKLSSRFSCKFCKGALLSAEGSLEGSKVEDELWEREDLMDGECTPLLIDSTIERSELEEVELDEEIIPLCQTF